ncbi:MAG: APC family permease [Shimia sp.]
MTRWAAMALERSMGFYGLTFYGVGTILGAGIFVVIGEVVANAGALSPVAYGLAGLVAVFSALSFAEIAARIPSAGGPIEYMERAYPGRAWLAFAVGWALVLANIVSGATITTGFAQYLGSFVPVANWMAVTGLVIVLTVIASIGMKQSAWFMTTTTIIGLVTLALIVWINREGLIGSPAAITDVLSGDGGGSLGVGFYGVLAAAFIAVYSFIGFGDVAQTAEEVKDVKKTLPRAMIVIIIMVFAAYLIVSAAITGAGDLQELADADAPLVQAVERYDWPGLPFAIASLFVIVNGGLTQIIAAARLLLELARDGNRAPSAFAQVNGKTGTPIIATVASSAVVLLLALFIPLGTLASATSLVILVVFFAVNLALQHLKKESQPDDVPNMPMFVPILGMVFCAVAVVGQVAQWLLG